MIGNTDFLADLGAEPVRSKGGVRNRKPAARKVTISDIDPPVKAGLSGFVQAYVKEIFVTAAVIGLIGSATVNALFLQDAKHPAPLFAAESISPAQTAAIPKQREIRLNQVGQNDQTPLADPLVTEIQRNLAARGYYDSDIDGLMGARTRTAIGLYQRAFNATVTYEASQSLLDHIRLSNPESDYHAKARQRVADTEKTASGNPPLQRVSNTIDAVSEDPERIKQVQRALSKLGYKLVDDGVAGPNTRQAIADFKRKRGLDGSGAITVSLLNELINLRQL